MKYSSALCVVLLRTVKGSSDSNFNPSDGASRYLFMQHVSVDPDGDSVNLSSETESLAFYSDSEDQMDESSSSIVSSSLLYDGGCLMSSQALMCNGGDLFMNSYMSPHPVFDPETDDEDEDDDDDDDDGHSSMLSNASVRRARASANGVPQGSTEREVAQLDPFFHSVPPHSQTSFLSKSSVLSIRGGGAADLGSEFAKRLLVSAIVTLVYEALLGHFLEFIKIVMQTSPPGTTYLDVIKLITKEKGLTGIYDGFVPWGVVQAVFKGGVFGLAYSMASSLLLLPVEKGMIAKQVALTLAGGIGGGFQGYVLSPTLLLKTRVMTNPIFRESMSLWRTTLLSFRIGFDVVSSEGIGALMKGSNIFAMKRVFDWATRYYFSDVVASLIKKQKGGADLTAGEMVTADLVGGFFSTLSTLPLDVLVAKTQDAKKAGVSVSTWTMLQEDLKERGWGGLANEYMSGFVARLAHVCFTTVAMKTGTKFVYDALFGEKQ